ncbi:MAG: RNA polymerase factor sigma-54 [Tannerella sp.]|nr:RNA polymerase factor sigma-54 [Tannerella sp.]
MALKHKQNLKQQQRILPLQMLAVKLLELPVLEIEDRIRSELDENPALEEGREASNDTQDELNLDETETDSDREADNEDFLLGDYMTEDDIPAYKLAEMNSRQERKEAFMSSDEQSLTDYLMQQLKTCDMSDNDFKIAEYIIGNIDDDGYLRRDCTAISDDIAFQTGYDAPKSEIVRIVHIIQGFDPPGVGAFDLRECLMLQLQKGTNDPVRLLAKDVLQDYFDDFTHKKYDRICDSLNISEDDLKDVIKVITSLNPKPGGNWDDSMTTIMNRVIPDFIVDTFNGELSMTLNNRNIPDLRVNKEYSDLLKDYVGNKINQTSDMRDAIVFVKQKIDAAQGFINAVKERQETLRRTMEAIMLTQQEFFLTGDESKLKPMILKDLAEMTHYDISTVSRVSNSKYVQTNFGVLPLKFFFSEAARTESGETVSTRKIKQTIKEAIETEDKNVPITDDVLTNILKEKGFIIARRTVAKYREQLGIPVARMRKEI